MAIGRDGRPQPWLAETWSTSADGRLLNVRLRPGVTFHDGQPVTAAVLREILVAQLPEYLGLVYDDVAEIRPRTLGQPGLAGRPAPPGVA